MRKMSTAAIRRTRRALLAFYDARRRALPWRGGGGEGAGPEPYGVWISEVMLQQTRVETVVPYYRAWMERFPDVAALAGAPLDDVLRVWEGLGYYARARQLHRAAALVRERPGGALPRSAAELRALPGIGAYTAGAIASIAFGERVPAVDGNVRRVLARLLDEPEPGAAWLRERAAALVDPERPGDFNQALMELGATVCTARAPRCAECPLGSGCAARRAGTVGERPRPKRRAPLPEREFGVAVLLRPTAGGGAEVLLVRRPEEGLLGGLWELPSAPLEPGGSARAAAAGAAGAAGAAPAGEGAPLPPRRHVYSHFRGIYRPYLWNVSEPAPVEGEKARRAAWVGRAGLAARALPAVHRRILDEVPPIACLCED